MRQKLFLEWEIKLWCAQNKPVLPLLAYAASLAACVEDITVNQIRKDFQRAGLGVTLHPDDRGSKKVWQDNEDRAGDDKIPDIYLQGAQAQTRADNAGLSEEELKAKFPALFP